MRTATLLPAATEIVCALGRADALVGISHECDYPAAVQHLPRLTTTPIDATKPSAVIDADVRAARDAGRPVIGVDAAQLRALAPELVITQALCDVCAVADGEVVRLAKALDPPPRVVTLAGQTLDGILLDVRLVAEALDAGPAADLVAATLRGRLDALRARPLPRRPRVLCIEWLEPLYLAGHWVPELVAAAGGDDVGAAPGEHSARRTWPELSVLAPDVIVVMLCGFGVARARAELEALEDPAARAVLARQPVWILDGNAYTSRPGPRVADGAERLRAAFEGRAMEGLERWR